MDMFKEKAQATTLFAATCFTLKGVTSFFPDKSLKAPVINVFHVDKWLDYQMTGGKLSVWFLIINRSKQ